jgi:DNA-binding response OmpR family regulator
VSSYQDDASSIPSVLLVIDDLPSRAFISTFFARRGWNVLESAGPDEAAFLLGKTPGNFELALFDLVINGGSGRVIADWLFEGRQAPPKVFLYDPWSYIPPRLRATVPGAHSVLELPVTEKKLQQLWDRTRSTHEEIRVSDKLNKTSSAPESVPSHDKEFANH